MRFARDYFLSWQIVKCLGFSLGTNVKPDNPYLVGRGIPMRKLYVDFVLAKATLSYQINVPVRLSNFEKNLDRRFVIIF